MPHIVRTEIALEELKILQQIVARHDDLSFKIKGWCVTLVTAIILAIKSDKYSISVSSGLSLLFGISLLFLWIDVIYRVAEDRAISRSRQVERLIRDHIVYDGPKIAESLSVKTTFMNQMRSLNNIRIYVPYISISIIVLAVTFMH